MFLTVSPQTKMANSLLDNPNPRESLLSLYSLNSVPRGLSDTVSRTKAFRNQPFTPNLRTTSKDIVVREKEKTNEAIKALFANDSHPLLKREEISYAILTNNFSVPDKHYTADDGDYDGIDEVNAKELHETRLNAHLNRHNYERPPILEVMGDLDQPTHRDIGEERKRYLQNLPCKGTSYMWSGDYFEPEAPMVVPRKAEQAREKLPNAGSVAIQNRR